MQFDSFQPSGLAALQGASDTYASFSKMKQERADGEARNAAAAKALEIADRRVNLDEQREARAAEAQGIATQRAEIEYARLQSERQADGALASEAIESFGERYDDPELDADLDRLQKQSEYIDPAHLPFVFRGFIAEQEAKALEREKADNVSEAESYHESGILNDEELETFLKENEESDAPGEASAKLSRIKAAAVAQRRRQISVGTAIQRANTILNDPDLTGVIPGFMLDLIRDGVDSYALHADIEPTAFTSLVFERVTKAYKDGLKANEAKINPLTGELWPWAQESSGAQTEQPQADSSQAAPKYEEALEMARNNGATEELAKWFKDRGVSPDDMPHSTHRQMTKIIEQRAAAAAESGRVELELRLNQ
jgi:hypothetical protein